MVGCGMALELSGRRHERQLALNVEPVIAKYHKNYGGELLKLLYL